MSDPLAAAPAFEVTLAFSCGCIERWPVYQLPGDAETVIDVPCVPEGCQACLRDGLCSTRRAMSNYLAVQFAEITPVARRYRRLKLPA